MAEVANVDGGKGEAEDSVWQTAKKGLLDELSRRPAPVFESDSVVSVQEDVLRGLKLKDMLKLVFNASSPGEVEVLVRPSNRQELAFKLKTSERPFALIKIGDVSGWLKDELAGYEVNERFEDESYFERLNAPDSDVNILMGSRSFYEGWDSNRPNVANFINIGVGTDARKWCLRHCFASSCNRSAGGRKSGHLPISCVSGARARSARVTSLQLPGGAR